MNWQGEKNETFLHICIKKNAYHYLVEKLLENGADPALVNEEGKTALHLALEKQSHIIINFLNTNPNLWTMGDNQGITPLHLLQKNLNLFKIILTGNSNFFKLEHLNWQGENKETFLHLCIKKSYVGLVKELLDLGVDTNLKNDEGETARSLAEKSSNGIIQNAFNELLKKNATE